MANDVSAVTERNHYLIVPTDNAQRLICERIEQVSRAQLVSQYHIRMNQFYSTTVTCVYLEAMIQTLISVMRENKGEAVVHFFDLFSIASSNRTNDDADKDGNINIRFIPGPGVESIMERDYFQPVTEEMCKDDPFIKAYEKACSRILATKHKMTSNSPRNWTFITVTYMEFLFRTLKLMVRTAAENGESSIMINFLEMFEAHAAIEITANPENPELFNEKIDVKLRPGFSAKLSVKSDEITEVEDDD